MTTPKPPAIFTPRTDAHCRHCAFSLAGLPDHGNCPECGTAYDPSNSHHLLQAPGVTATLGYFAAVIGLGFAATIVSIVFIPFLCIVTIPGTLIWLGRRLHVYRRTMHNRVLPPGMSVPPGTRTLGMAAEVLAALIVGVGTALLLGSILLFAICLSSL